LKVLSLYQLNEYIRRVIALNFTDTIWVSGEMAQIAQSKGHYYIDLIEKKEGDEEIIAYASCVIWAGTFRKIQRSLGRKLNDILLEGLQVRMQVQVDFHERYGLKLVVLNIDPDYTMGALALQRLKTIEVLRKKKIIDQNKNLSIPLVIQRIAIISSVKAAGFQDYIEQLRNNELAYDFRNQLYAASVQGVFAEKEILARLEQIERKASDFDCVIIVRGGGAKLDLMAFDSLSICEKIAQFPIPVFCGIGHDIDETVLDMVANQSLKTPTAVAEYILNHNMRFEGQVLELANDLEVLAHQIVQQEDRTLNHLEELLKIQSEYQVKSASSMIDYIEREIPSLLKFKLKQAHTTLNHLDDLIQLVSPEQTLKRGFSITYKDGKAITGTKKLKKGDNIETRFSDGTIESQIIKTKK